MTTKEVLEACPVVTLDTYTDNEFDYVLEAHRRVFCEEFGWSDRFMEDVREILLTYVNREKTDRETFLIAKVDGKPVGTMMLIELPSDPTVAQLRVLTVDESYRGLRIGSRLMTTLLEKAKADGYRKVILWTCDQLIVARKYYAKLGFTCTQKEENRHWDPNGKLIMEELWEMDL